MTEEVDPVATYRTGWATKYMVCLSGAMDAFDPDEPYSQVYLFDIDGPEWSFNEHDDVVSAVCLWTHPNDPEERYFVVLCENGDVVFEDENLTSERIPDAGIGRPDSKGYGYLTDLRQIGAALYACGARGQVYRRGDSGRWTHVDHGVLQAPGGGDPVFVPAAIEGASEDDIYLVGCTMAEGSPPKAFHWNGKRWRALDLPAGCGRLTGLFVENASSVWMCGDNGSVLVGSAGAGFVQRGRPSDDRLIYSITLFQGVGFVGTNLGLFQFNPSAQTITLRKVRTGLVPEVDDANVVVSVDDEVLWSIGGKDIVRLENGTWTRYRDPDNVAAGA